jgi:hypothetical protein
MIIFSVLATTQQYLTHRSAAEMYHNNITETGAIFTTNVSHLENLSSGDMTGCIHFENR